MIGYPNGTPNWVELYAPDTGAAADFYGRLFGWSVEAPESAHRVGGYQMFRQADADVAGLMPVTAPEQPSAWLTYIAVDNADATAEKVASAGGETFVPPTDVMHIGRMAAFADPSGAAFGVWQARSFPGAGLVNEPVSVCWNEVLTRDSDAALAFYPDVFGWKAVAPGFASSGGYTMWERPDGQAVGGMMEMTDAGFPAEMPAHWSVCFAVRDCDETVTTATELGASVTMAAMDCPVGRFAGFVDPQGAAFSVMALAA